MGCLSRSLGSVLLLIGMLMALFVLGHAEMIVGPGFRGAAWWWMLLGRTWDGFGICLLVVASGVGLIVMPGRLARWHKRRDEIKYLKPGSVDDLA